MIKVDIENFKSKRVQGRGEKIKNRDRKLDKSRHRKKLKNEGIKGEKFLKIRTTN